MIFDKFVKIQASRLKGRFWSSETAVMITFAVLVGLGAGLGTIIFVNMIEFFHDLFFEEGKLLGLPGTTYVILLPIIGGLIVGPLVHFIAPEAKGHGVPEVLTAITTKGGRIRPVVVLVKALGSAITIGSGGSVGREGPIVQIGAALGSTFGQIFKLNERRTINLVGSGAAAGIAATFNAPIAGVMFAMEVILGDFGLKNFSTLVISAVTASVVSQAVLGDSPSFIVPAYTLKNPWELLLYVVLGILSGLGAFLFVKILYFMEDLFDNWKFPPYLKPAIGGIGLGILGFFLPQVFGTGFDTIARALTGKIGLSLLVLLVFGKILATTITLGAGSSGGVFAPALFIGAVLGGAFGEAAQFIFPGLPASSGAYAMVGMAAVFAGAARAPITAIIILFEMTRDYRIILPLMFATIISTLIARNLEPESIYTLKLVRKGINIRARQDENLICSITVGDTMTPIDDFSTISYRASTQELANLFQETSHHGCIVLDDRDELYGMVTLSDLERAIDEERHDSTVGDICTRTVLTLFPDETLDDALRHFGAMDVGRIPVVNRANPRHVLGVLRRSNIVHSLSMAMANKHKSMRRINRLRMEALVGSELVELYLSKDDAMVGKRLNAIKLPENCVIVSIQRGRRVVVPRGHTQLLAGDRLIALTADGNVERFKNALSRM
ncbi:MAG: chloride channel protein [Anaerolineales bacterium]|nr:chloride channel protein [Anaerolineales bacterium]